MTRRARTILYKNRPSNGAVALCREMGIKYTRNNTTYVPGPRDTIINWGCTEAPAHWNMPELRCLNHPDHVNSASNKVLFMRLARLHGLLVVDSTESQEEAQGWADAGRRVFVRKLARASAGRGVGVVGPEGTVPRAPLYTKYFDAASEYRLHFVQGNLIKIHKKRRRSGAEHDRYVRTHANGWVFCTEGVAVPPLVVAACAHTLRVLYLDFGAVDVRVKRNGEFRILEVNTAPGLEGDTVSAYARAFAEL